MKKTNETPEETELWNSIPNLDKKDRGDTYFRLSLIAFEKGLHANSLTLAESACDAYRESEDEVGLANAYTAIAFNFYVNQKAKDGIKYMADAVNLYTKNSDEQEWEYRNHLLRWYMQEKQYELAKEQLFVLLEHYENDSAEYSLVEARKLLGISYCNLDDCDAAIKEFTKARVLAKELQDSRSIAELDLEMSQCFNHLEKPIDAHSAATKAAGVFDSIEDLLQSAKAQTQIGISLSKQGDHEKALISLEKARGNALKKLPINFFEIHAIQAAFITVLESLSRDDEAAEMKRRNQVIAENLGIGS
jgi:tetratricopeptide (TPR) repeat protein